MGMRLLLLALLGFLSIVIHGHGVQDENDDLAEAVSDVISLNENKGEIKTVDKRAAEAWKKHHNRPDSKRRTNKIKRKQGKKLSKKESKKKRKNGQRIELNKKNRRRTKKKAKRKGKRRRKGGNRIQKKNQVAKGRRNKPKNNKKKRKGNANRRRGNQKKKQAKKPKPQRKETNKKSKKKKRKNEKKQRNKEKLKRRKKKNRKNIRQENKFKKTRKKGEDKKPGSSSRALNCTNCVVTLAKYSRTYEGKCGSILRQYRRIQSFEKITKSKLNKKGSFVPTYNSLLSALGGNQSSPHCDGQTIGSNSSSQGYKDALSTLNTCESTINSTCKELLSEDLNKTLTNC